MFPKWFSDRLVASVVGFCVPVSALCQAPDTEVPVFLNHRSDREYAESYRHLSRQGDDLEAAIVAQIDGATTAIDMAIHELDLPRIGHALARARQRGVAVRVILENTNAEPRKLLSREEIAALNPYSAKFYNEYVQLLDEDGDGFLTSGEAERQDPLRVLRNAGIAWIDDTEDGTVGTGLMHDKFIVIDQQTVVLSTGNFTHSDLHGDFGNPGSRGNHNGLLLLSHPHLAGLFEQEFNFMWGDGPGGRKDSRFGTRKPFRPAESVVLSSGAVVTVQFSPVSPKLDYDKSVNGLIARSLLSVESSVDMAQFVMSDQRLVDALWTLSERGVRIRGVFEKLFASQYFSETLDMWGLERPNRRCEPEHGNRRWTPPLPSIAVADLPHGDILHYKYAILDHERLLVGSHNWSRSANHANDEVMLVVDAPGVARAFEREFDRVFQSSRKGPPEGLVKKVAAEWAECGKP